MKVSTDCPNIANRIARHVAQRFPELAKNPIGGIWFTGSNVWSLLYGETTPIADWDIFTLDELSALRLVTGMSWNMCPAFPTKQKQTNERVPIVSVTNIPSLSKSVDSHGNSYSEGYCYLTEQGEVDVWVCNGSALTELRTYPDKSHAHCRAAFSFTDGLIVLPNEAA